MSFDQQPDSGNLPDYMVSVAATIDNDGAILSEFLADIHRLLKTHYKFYEIIIVDNASHDNSIQIMQAALEQIPGLRWLRLTRQQSAEIATAAALEHCIGDFVAIVDPYASPVQAIPQFVSDAQKDNCIISARTELKPPISWPRRWLRRQFYRVANNVLELPISADTYFLQVLPRSIVNALTKIKTRRRYLRYFSAMAGSKEKVVTIQPIRRGAGRKPKSFFGSVRAGADLLISNSLAPLRWAARVGLFACGLNLLYLGYILIVAMFKSRLVEGWLTLSVVSTVMFLLLFLVLAVLAEYIGRILEETQDRPMYFLDWVQDSVVLESRENESNVV